MELIFAGTFLVLMAIFAGVSLLITEKVKDLIGVGSKVGAYTTSGIISGIVVWGTKFLGAAKMTFFLKFIVPEIPDLPTAEPPPDVGLGWFFWVLIWIGSWLVAGGIYDWRKKTR